MAVPAQEQRVQDQQRPAIVATMISPSRFEMWQQGVRLINIHLLAIVMKALLEEVILCHWWLKMDRMPSSQRSITVMVIIPLGTNNDMELWEEAVAQFDEQQQASRESACTTVDPLVVLIPDKDIKKMKNDELKKNLKKRGLLVKGESRLYWKAAKINARQNSIATS